MESETTFDAYLAEQMKDAAFQAEYEALEPEYAIMQAMLNARKATGLTQTELARKTGINQGDISRLERGGGNPSLRTLQRLAEALNMRLKVEFQPIH